MLIRLVVCALWLLPAWGVSTFASQRSGVESDQQILIGLEQKWNEAFYRKDLAFIEKILADDFIVTYEDGTRADKQKELAEARAFDQQVKSAIQDEFTVREYGDTAIVWFTLHLTGIKEGQPAEVTLRFTDVWVLRDQQWRCVSSQSTKMNSR